MTAGATEPDTLSTGTRQTGHDPFAQPGTLELGDGGKDVELQATGGRGRVEADEADAERRQFVDGDDQAPEVAPEPIQSPAHEHIKLPSLGILQQRIEGGPLVLRAADAPVHELVGGPANEPRRSDEAPGADSPVPDRTSKPARRWQYLFPFLLLGESGLRRSVTLDKTAATPVECRCSIS
jgi:hypothetical protein